MKVETATSPINPSLPGSAPSAEKWSLHPGEVMRRKRGLFRLRVPGYKVFPAEELRHRDYPGRATGAIYAVFEVEEDSKYAGRRWNGTELVEVIKNFEARMKHRPPRPLGRASAYPRVLSLRELVRALR